METQPTSMEWLTKSDTVEMWAERHGWTGEVLAVVKEKCQWAVTLYIIIRAYMQSLILKIVFALNLNPNLAS